MNYLNFFRSSDPSSTIDSRLIPKTTQIPEIEALPDPEQIAIEGDLGKLLERSSEWGEKFQKNKQEEQTLIQEKSLLRHLPWNENPTELDLKFLAQLSGEGFIRENPLEGYSFDKSIHYYIQFFEALLRNKDKSDVQVLTPYLARIQSYLDQMKACKKITEKIEAIVSAGTIADDEKKADLIKKYAEELSKDFSKGALEWFPAGWLNSFCGGHALMLKFEKNGTIAFVNSGAGLDYHDSAQYTIATENGSRNKTLHQQFLTIKSGDKARLGSVDFFQFLLEMNVYPRWEVSFKLGPKTIYEGLLKYLKGKVVGNHDPKKEEYLFKTAQRSGCCAVKAVSTGFYYHLCGIWGGKEKNPEKAAEAYKKVKFMWERQALISQCMSLLPEPSKLQDNPQAAAQFYPATEKLIEDIMQNMGREAESLYGKKLLSHEELLSIHATFLDIRERITVVKDCQVRVNSEIMHCERDYQVPQQQSLKIEIPCPNVNRARKPLDFDFDEDQMSKLSQRMMSSSVHSLNDPKEASKTLKNWLITLEPILTGKHDWLSFPDGCKIMFNQFQRILCELPIPGANESFWQQVPEDQILDCMRTLQQLMSVLAIVDHGRAAYSHTAETVTTSYACYAIITELAYRLPETKLKEVKSAVNYYDLLKQIRSPYFLNHDPKVQEQLTKVLKYFDSSYSIDNASQLTDSELAGKAKESLFCYDEMGWNGNEGPSLKINSVSVKQNKLLGYFAKFLQWDNPEVRKKLIAHGIAPDQPLEEQLKKLLCGDNPALPESVQILQHASLCSSVICKCHTAFTYSAASSVKSFDQLPSFRFSEVSGKCNWGSPVTIAFSEYEGYSSKNLESPLTEMVDRDLNPLLIADYEKTTQNKIIHQKIAQLGLNLEDSKELSMLGVDPYDEVNRTLSFALRHIPLLNKTSLQDIINIHLFKHGRILSQLKDSPQFAEQMTEFLEEALDYYLKSKDTETCLYLAKIGHRMALFAKHCGIKPQRPFPDFEKIILDSVIPMTKNYGLIKKSCEMIIKWHLPFNQNVGIDDASLQNIAAAMAMASLSSRLQIQGIAEDVGFSGLDHERTGTISKWGLNLETTTTQRYLMPKIKALMERDKIAREKLLNRALNMMITDDEGPYEWNGDFPNYSCGLYEINIETGVVKKNGKELVTLPESVLRDADFRRLKIKTITHVSKKDDTTYIIYPDEIEISYKDPRIEIRKKIDGTIYRLHNAAAEYLSNDIPTLFTEGYEYWISENPGSANQHCLCLKDGDPSIKLGLGQIYEDDRKVRSIERGDSEWVAFANIPASLKKVLNYIEPNSNYIECWRRKNQTVLESVNLKRLGLKFNIKQEGNKALAYCQEYPGFFISEQRYIVPTLLETDPYIVLENAAGEKKVVMPKLPLSSTISATSALNRTLIYSMPDKPTKALIEFSIQDGELYSSFIEPRIYLSLIYLAKGDYEKTSKLLKKLNVTAAFTKKDKIILEWMVQILDHDQHPAAVSILLSLVALTEENKLKFPLSVGTKNESFFNHQKIHQSYSQYMQNWGNIPAFRLSEDEEKSILLFLKKEGKVALDKMDFFARLAPEVGNAIKLVEKRLNELSTRSSELGYSSTERKQMQEDVLKFDYYSTFTYQHAFEDYQPPTTPKFQVDAILMRDSGLLMGKFAEFYDVATRGSLEERTKLKAFLDLQKGNIDEDHQTTYQLLLSVCQHSSSYPLVSVFKNALEKKKAAPQYDYTAMAECNKVFGKLFVESNRFVKLARVVHKIFGFLSLLFSMISFPRLFKSRYRWKNVDDTTIPKSTMLLLNGDPLEKIDKTFNSYFNKLIDTYFEFEEVPVEAATPHLPVDHANPLVKDKLQQENADLDAFEKMRPKTRRIHKVRPQANLKNLEDTLKKEILRWEGTLKAQKQAIIWQANCITAAKNSHKIGDVHRDAHQQKVTWQDLQDSFCRGDIESFKQKTQLNEDEINRLFQGIADYSMKKSRLDQFKHVTVAIKAYDKSAAEVKKEDEAKKEEEAKKEDEIASSKASSSKWRLWPLKQASKNASGIVREKECQEREHRIGEAQAKKDLYLQHVVTAMNLFPAYQKSYKKRSEMLFELANGYFYRQEQIQKHFEIMDSLNSNPEILAQMRTGFGKTKTVVPTLDIKLAEQGKLVVNVWPASLEETNTQDVKAQLEKSFARPVDAMKFDRSTEITEENLEKRYLELQKDIKEGRPLNIRPETIRALEAHLILMLNECHSKEVDASAYAKQLEYLLKIHHLIRVTTAAFIDEAKHNLDPRDKLIYTSGKPQTLPVDDVNLIEDMFKILSEPPFSQILDIKNNNHPLVSKQVYEEKIALELVKVFEKKWKIVSDYSKDFRQFILGEMQDVPRWMTWHPKLSQMCLLRGEMLFILNTACRGYVGQQFGLSQKHFATKQFAIPYVSANTPKETERAPSECKNPHEALNKTYITYLEQGLAKDQVSKLIETLQELAFKETGVGMTFDKTPSNQFFLKICPNSKKTLNNLNKEDIQNMYTDLKHNNAAIFYYIRHVIVQQIVYYPKTITSTTQNFRSQFAKSISLSATPQDPGAHGPNTLLLPVKGTAGQVTHVLYTKCKEAQTIHQLKATTSRELMKETQALAGKDLAMQATVDVGALYKGISNQTLAEHTCQELRESRANIEAVVFFDDRGDPQRFMVMDVMNGQIQPLDGCSIDPTKRYTIYDQHRSYGSDIPQAFSAKGLILLSKESTKSEAAQGWGRFRQGDKILEGQIKGQTPVFAIPLNVSQEIFKKDPNITDLLVHLAMNEAIANSEFNYESLKEQMDNEIRRALLDKLEGVQIGESSKKPVPDAKKIQVDVKKALQLFAHYQKELIVEESFDPLLLYARTPKAEDTVKFLVQYQKRCIERVQKCRGLSKAEKKFIIDRLGKYSAKWSGNRNSLSLPPQVKATSSALGLACEVFAEVETQVNTSTQVESGTTEVLRTPSVWKEKMDLYAAGWERPSAMRLTLLRMLTAKVTSVSRRINKAWDTMSYDTKNKLIITSVGLTVVNFIYKIGLLAGVKFLTFGSPLISSVAIPILLAALPVSLIVLGSRQLIVQTKIWKNLTTTICKNYRLKEVLGKHLPKEILSAKELFSPNFLASDNFYRQNTLGILEPIQKVLDDEQKPLFQVLVIQDEHRGKKQVQFLAIDQNDSQYFRKRLQMDQEVDVDVAKVSQRTRKLAVVDVRTGKIVAQGKNGFEKDELELNPDFNSLLTQAKLLDGEILYSNAEQTQLRAAVTKVGQKCVRKFFEEYVLPLHPSNKHCYVNKPIAQILGKVA